MNKFKVGDEVYWKEWKGIVISTNNSRDYPLLVNFGRNSVGIERICSFTSQGSYEIGEPPELRGPGKNETNFL